VIVIGIVLKVSSWVETSFKTHYNISIVRNEEFTC